MNIENVRAFILYGLDTTKTTDKMQLGGVGACCLAAFGFLPAFSDLKNTFSVIGAVILAILMLVYFAYVVKIPKVLTLTHRVLTDAVNTAFMVFALSLVGAIFFSVSSTPSLIWVSFAPLMMSLVTVLGAWLRVKKNKYLSKKNRPELMNIAGFVAIGAFVGKRFSDVYSDGLISAMTMEVYMAVLSLLIALCFAIIGPPSFLKLVYLKRSQHMGTPLDR